MSTQPTGSMTLICPVGDAYSTIDPLNFASFAPNGHQVFEVSANIFAQWYQNAKRIKFDFVRDIIDTEPPGSSEHIEETKYATQWSYRGDFGNPLTENLSDHPFPLLYFQNGQLNNVASSTLDDAARIRYYEEGTGTGGSFVSWMTFIHLGKFYIVVFQNVSDGEVLACSVDADAISITQQIAYDTFSDTVTRTATINQRFYP